MGLADLVTAEHVRTALTMLDDEYHQPYGTPTKYVLVHDGRKYASKAVVHVAYEVATGAPPTSLSGGMEVNQASGLLRHLGFSVVDKGDADREIERQANASILSWYKPFSVALTSMDRAFWKLRTAKAEQERAAVLKDFPLDAWSTLAVERFAQGTGIDGQSFCTWMEQGTGRIGRLPASAASIHLVFKKADGDWYFPKKYDDIDAAWKAVRGAYNRAFELAAADDHCAIDELTVFASGSLTLHKALHVYFPKQYLPISASSHLRHLAQRVYGALWSSELKKLGHCALSNRLLIDLRKHSQLAELSSVELMYFLYWWAHPKRTPKVLKVPPGDGAKYWDDCLAGHYVCVGWDEIGDLTEYDGKTEFKEAFYDEYLDGYEGKKSVTSRKANEVWRLRMTEPGDVILANDGVSRLVGIGRVQAPGYVWNDDRTDYKHTVSVHWDPALARDIPKQGAWSTTTVVQVEPHKFDEILGGEAQRVSHHCLLVNHKVFDIEAAAQNLKQDVWALPKGDVAVGDKIAFWRTSDASGRRGVVAFGEVTTAAAETEVSKEAKEFWLVDPPEGPHREFGYRYLRAPGLPLWLEDDEDGLLSSLSVSGGQGNKLYRLSPEQWSALVAKAGGLSRDIKPVAAQPFSLDHALKDLFMRREQADEILASLKRKRNVVLQGPPGVGKSFMARRLAYALIGEKDPTRVEMVQFHQSYSYEDFIQGFRPNEHGKFKLKNGVFYEFCARAMAAPTAPHVFIIDEINRGNLSKIFGELMLLIEADKRGSDFAMPLTYSSGSHQRFYVPDNVHLIGLMNTADRSLAMLDYALRRRFVFHDISPEFHSEKFAKHLASMGVKRKVRTLITERVHRLNELIEGDAKNLGKGFCIGHSYFTPMVQEVYRRDWYETVVRTEIAPLLREYWFDNLPTATKHIDELLAK